MELPLYSFGLSVGFGLLCFFAAWWFKDINKRTEINKAEADENANNIIKIEGEIIQLKDKNEDLKELSHNVLEITKVVNSTVNKLEFYELRIKNLEDSNKYYYELRRKRDSFKNKND